MMNLTIWETSFPTLLWKSRGQFPELAACAARRPVLARKITIGGMPLASIRVKVAS